MTKTAFVTEPATGLKYYELSHEWGHHTPVYPGFKDTVIFRSVSIATHGVMSQRVKMTMHNSTHVNAPLHLLPGKDGVGQIDVSKFFGNGIVLSIPKSRWELIEVADLEPHADDIDEDDFVIINMGWHKLYSDSQEYFGHAPGLSKAAAEWLVAKKIKILGVDTPNVDHPMATLLGPHRKGPIMRRVVQFYEKEIGHSPKLDYPDFVPAHKALLEAGIPTIENVGGDIEAVTGQRCTFHAMPWRWEEGDACVVRLVALQDPAQTFRLDTGA